MDQRDDYAEPVPPPFRRLPSICRRRLGIGIGVLLLLLGISALIIFFGFVLEVSDRHYATSLSISRADDAAEACRIYYLNNPDKKYPASLTELGSLLADLDHDLKDGWGNPLHYALVPNADGELEPYVWAERTWNGKTTLHGAKRTADGQRVLFGMPDD